MLLSSLFISVLMLLSTPPIPVQPPQPLVFRQPLIRAWDYDVEVVSQSGEVTSTGWGSLERREAIPVPSDINEEPIIQFHPTIPDSSLIAGPWLFRWIGSEAGVFDNVALTETSLGVIRIRSFPDAPYPFSMTTLILSSEIEVGHSWGTSPDAHFEIAALDTVEFNNQTYPTVYVRWQHIPDYGDREEYVWALSLGILELRRPRKEDGRLTGEIVHYQLRGIRYN